MFQENIQHPPKKPQTISDTKIMHKNLLNRFKLILHSLKKGKTVHLSSLSSILYINAFIYRVILEHKQDQPTMQDFQTFHLVVQVDISG